MNNTSNPIFSKFDQILGKTTPTVPTGGVPSRADQLMKFAPENKPSNLPSSLGTPQPTQTPPTDKPSYLSNLMDAQSSAGDQMTSGFQQTQKASDDFNKGTPLQGLGTASYDMLSGAGQEVGGALNALTAPISAGLKTIGDTNVSGIGNNKQGDTLGGNIMKNGIQPIADLIASNPTLQSIVTKYPGLQQDLPNIMNIGLTLLGGEKAPEAKTAITNGTQTGLDTASNVAKGVIDTGSRVGDAVTNTISGTPAEQATANAAKQLKSSIDAVNSDPTGKNLVNAYKKTVTGGREVTPSSVFKEQGLTPEQQTINLGTRLQDLGLGNDPVKNLTILKTALGDTETKLSAALKGDPEVNFNADKPTLLQNLEGIKKSIPREFSTIKDSKAVFNNVINFAKETVTKADDSIEGLRDARTAFDNQAKTEYPNAFKDGKVDVKTPAGRAIKQGRDMISQHLYDTAPNGSEIQSLIGREADIFRATDSVSEKAAAGHGQTSYQKMKANNPKIRATIEVGKKIIPYGIGSHL